MFLRDNLKKLVQLAKSVETDVQNKTETCIHIQNRNLTKQKLEKAKKGKKKTKFDDKTI